MEICKISLIPTIIKKEQYRIPPAYEVFKDKFLSYYKELWNWPSCKFYKFSDSLSFLVEEAGACLVFETKQDGELSKENVMRLLDERRAFHRKVISNSSNIMSLFQDEIPADVVDLFSFGQISYVFTFYSITENNGKARVDTSLLKSFAEPSSVDLDDMTSSFFHRSKYPLNIKNVLSEKVVDVDISPNSLTFVTWPMVLNYNFHDGDLTDSEFREHVNNSKSLLLSLEIKLQILWNKTFTLVNDLEKIYRKKTHLSNKEWLQKFWHFSRELDIVYGTEDSCTSSRAKMIFEEMVKTSGLKSLVTRFETRLQRIDLYFSKKESLDKKKYQIGFAIFALFFSLVAFSRFLGLDKNFQLLGWRTESKIGLLVAAFGLGVFLLLKGRDQKE